MGPKKKTRQTAGSCYGPPVKMPDSGSLLTLRDVLAGVDYEQMQFPDLSGRKHQEVVEKYVRQKFFQANPRLPLISEHAAVIKIERAVEAAHLIHHKKLKSKKKKHFFDSLDKTFDLVICQCEIVVCGTENHKCSGAHVICNCAKTDKVPDLEAAWLKDQRTKIGTEGGNFIMRGVDKKEAKKFKSKVEKEMRKVATEDRRRTGAEELKKKQDVARKDVEMECVVFKDQSFNQVVDEEFVHVGKLRSSNQNQNRTNLDYFIAEVVRYGWSDRGAAAAYNAALKTVGVIVDGNDKLAVDKNKIRRERDSFGAKQKYKQKSQVEQTGGLKCIGCDGKRNKKTKQREVQIINDRKNCYQKSGTHCLHPRASWLISDTF